MLKKLGVLAIVIGSCTSVLAAGCSSSSDTNGGSSEEDSGGGGGKKDGGSTDGGGFGEEDSGGKKDSGSPKDSGSSEEDGSVTPPKSDAGGGGLPTDGGVITPVTDAGTKADGGVTADGGGASARASSKVSMRLVSVFIVAFRFKMRNTRGEGSKQYTLPSSPTFRASSRLCSPIFAPASMTCMPGWIHLRKNSCNPGSRWPRKVRYAASRTSSPGIAYRKSSRRVTTRLSGRLMAVCVGAPPTRSPSWRICRFTRTAWVRVLAVLPSSAMPRPCCIARSSSFSERTAA